MLDRGFMFGDGVYEVIPAYGRRLFRLDAHLERLERSMEAIRLPNPFTREQWRQVLGELIRRNSDSDQSVYLQVTRGSATREHTFPPETHPTVLAMASTLTPPTEETLRGGVAAITRKDIRWDYCNIKAITLLANILLRQEAADAGAVEAILLRDETVTEGAASSVFVVQDGSVVTPSPGEALLPGITRDLILELCVEDGIPCHEADITLAALHGVDELWLTSSTKEILPVTQLDNQPVGTGVPGPVWQRVYDLYQAYKQRLKESSVG